MSKRMIFHRVEARLSIGVNISDNGDVTAAVAACHPNDQFKRSTANLKLNGRLNGNADLIGVYEGDSPGEDVYGPVRDAVRDLNKRRNVNSLITLMRDAIQKHQLAW